jgi:hypothetical protein
VKSAFASDIEAIVVSHSLSTIVADHLLRGFRCRASPIQSCLAEIVQRPPDAHVVIIDDGRFVIGSPDGVWLADPMDDRTLETVSHQGQVEDVLLGSGWPRSIRCETFSSALGAQLRDFKGTAVSVYGKRQPACRSPPKNPESSGFTG